MMSFLLPSVEVSLDVCACDSVCVSFLNRAFSLSLPPSLPTVCSFLFSLFLCSMLSFLCAPSLPVCQYLSVSHPTAPATQPPPPLVHPPTSSPHTHTHTLPPLWDVYKSP